MPVYSYKTLDPILSEVEYAAARFFNHMPLILSTKEVEQAFIRNEHVEVLKTAHDIVGGFSSSMPIPLIDVSDEGRIRVRVVAETYRGLPLPAYAANGLSPDCPSDVRNKIVSWAKQRVELGLQFNIVRDAIRELNELCNDAGTLRAMVPCLPYLMSKISDIEDSVISKRASKVAAMRSVGRVPMLPRQVKDDVLAAAGVVGSVGLLDEAPVPTPKAGEVVLQYCPSFSDQKTLRSTNIFDHARGDAPRYTTIL